jgi:hypothetical protein
MQWKNSNLIFSTVKMYPRSDSSKKLKLIASLMASCHAHGFTKYTFNPNSLLLTRQKKNSLRTDTSAKHSIKQHTFANAYLIFCHHKKRRNSMPSSTNRFLFKGTLGLLPTKPVHTRQNQIQCQAFPYAHSLFQKPMKAWYAMKSNAFATSTSSAGKTKVNGLHLLLELPRKTVRFDSSQTFIN